MATQFSGTPQIKTRTALLIFVKGSSAPVVLYVENPQAAYEEFQQLLKNPGAGLIEKEGNGPIKKLSLISSQISAVAIQDEQYV
ncbi:MAG: hypothetical protein WCY19_04170 [Candidatus Gastranaerophilaceae bacterium]